MGFGRLLSILTFIRGRADIKDEHRSDWLISVTTSENIDYVREMILQDSQIEIKHIVEVLHVFYERVSYF